jgi:hypothetical protein
MFPRREEAAETSFNYTASTEEATLDDFDSSMANVLDVFSNRMVNENGIRYHDLGVKYEREASSDFFTYFKPLYLEFRGFYLI